MDKLFTSLLAGLLLCAVSLSAQQPTFTISPTSNDIQPDDVFDVDITVSDFENILSMQYGITWDSTIIEFQQVKNINTANIPGFSQGAAFSTPNPGGSSNVPANGMGVSWFHPSFITLDLPDGTVLFTLEFQAIGCGTSDIQFSGPPTPGIELLDGSFTNVGLNPENATATVSGGNCGTVTPETTFSIANTTLDVGETGCVEVEVQDFENITDVSFSITYNENILDFSSIGSFGITGLDASDFDTTIPGVITLNWSNATGVSLIGGAAIFEICFTGAQAGTANLAFSDNPVAIAVMNADDEAVDFIGENGAIVVQEVQVTLDLTNTTVDVGQTGCVDVRVSDFDNIGDLQLTINYNSALVDFSSVTGINLPGLQGSDFNTTTPGVITVNWSSGSGVTEPDGTTIFELCFTGSAAGTASLSFGGASSAATAGGTPVNFNGLGGTVTVNSVNTDLTLTVENATVNQGDNVCLALEIDNFDGIIGMSFTVSYDASQLSYTGVTNLNGSLPGFSVAGNIANPSPGFVTINWFENSLTPITLPDGSVILEVCFDAIGSGTTGVEITSDVAAIEFSDIDENIIPLTSNDGTVTINGGPPPTGDLTLTVENATVNQGDNVCLALEIDNFDGIIGMSFTVSYDASQLSYTGVTNLNGSLPGFSVAGNIANPSPGFVTINWFENSLTPITLPDGSVILEVCFDAIGSGTTGVEITSDVAAIEFSDIDENIIPLTSNDGTVTINGGPPPTGDLTLTVENATVNQGDNVCLALEIDNFEDIIGMSFTVSYDASQLSYTGVTNLNGSLPGFSVAGNIANPSPGFVTINWFENSLTPITLPNGSVILEVCFDAIGSGTTGVEITSDVAAIEFSDIDENIIPLTSNDGTVTINGGPPPTGDLTLTVENAAVNQGDNVCLALEIDNFEDIIGMSFTVSYDASQLSYTGVTNLNGSLPGFSVAGNIANPSPGFVTINWFENSLTPITLPNGSVILEVCFDAIGSGTTGVEITSDVAAIEFSDIDENIIPLTSNDGTVNINGGPPPTDDLTVTAGSSSANQGETVCVPITVDNFTDLVGMSFTVSYDASLLTFTNVQNLTGSLPGFSEAGNIGNPGPGQVTVNWFENSLNPTTLPNGTVLFEVCFEALGGGSAAVDITSEVAAIEFSDADENVVPPVINNGTITISGDPTPDGLFLTIDDQTVDPGDQFCTSVKAFNFEGVVGMSFTISYNPAVLTLDDITGLTSNLPGFSEAANIGTPSAGFITVNWFENSLTPTTLPDGEVLFDICFTAMGSGVTSDIEFTSDVAAIEFSDANEDIIPFDSDPGTITFTGVTTDLTLTAGSLDVGPAESFCVPVTVQNFEDIVGMSFTLNYDATHLSFDQVTNLTTNLTGFTVAANIGNPSAGFITVNWFENSLTPTSLPNNEVLFEVCFTALGVDGSCSDLEFTSDIAAIEFSDADENIIPAFFEDGTVCIEDNVPGQVQVEVGDASVDLDASVCVPVSVDAFTDITDFGFTLEYNANQLQFDNLDAITSMLPNFSGANINTSTPGIISVSWSGGAATLANGTVLFDLCFTAIGTEDTCSDVVVTGSDEPINFISSTLGSLSFGSEEGTICINSAFDGFRLSIPDQTVQPGEQVCVPVNVLNFLDVVGFAFTINYDETQLSFQNINNLNPSIPDFSLAGNFGVPSQIGTGNISVNWFSQSIAPVDLPNGAILFEICFTVLGDDGDVSDITFSSDVTPIEISDSNGDIIPFNSEPGTITVSAVQPPNIAQANITDVDCFGEATGTIALTVNGGTGGPYSYAWNNNATTATINSLTAGNYTVTVTDMGNGGLMTTATYTIDAPSSAVAITGGVTAPTCLNGTNGSINLNVTGGNPGYTIAWDNGIQSGQTNPSNLPGGTYCVTVTDENGCTAENCYNVPNGTGQGAAINETVQDESCAGENDGSITLSVSGAVGTANYFWSTAPGVPGSSTLNNLSPGTYSVTVIDDASCQSTETFNVEEASAINLFEGITDVSCAGEATGIINLAVSGGNGGFSYNWSGPNNFSGNTSLISNLVAGQYSVVVTDANDCTASDLFMVDEPDAALAVQNIDATPIDQGVDGGVNLQVGGGTTPYTYNWSGPGNFSSSVSSLVNLNEQGEYCVTVTDANNCTTTACVTVEQVLRINSNITDACFGEANGAIELNVDGGVPTYTYAWTGTTATGAVATGLAAGNYSVTVTDSNNEMASMSFIVGASPEINFNPTLIPVTGASTNTNGSITLNATGGTSPLTYEWSGPNAFSANDPSISNLGTGEYCVTITDNNFNNNCSKDTCFNVFFADPMSAPAVTAVGTSCSYTEDGSLEIQINGGVPNYTIEVTDAEGQVIAHMATDNSYTVEDLPPGSTMIVITDALGAEVSTTISIPSPAPLQAAAPDYSHATEGNCNGQVSVSISGGTPQYTVTWNNGSIGPSIGGLCPDQWYVPTVTDANGCTIEVDSVFINNFDVQVGAVEFTSCPEDTNGSIDITVTGGDPSYTFVWNNANGNQVSNVEDPTGLMAGTYTLIITEASGNMLTRQVVIETESSLAVAVTSEENYNGFDVSCADATDGALSAIATGSSGYLYEWTNVATSMLVGTGEEIVDLPAGTYQLMVQDEVGCTATNQIELVAPDSITVEAFIQDVLCNDGRNGAITANVDGAIEPLDYFWSNGGFGNRITQLEPAAYSVTVLDGNNCQQTAIFEVENPEPVTLTFETEPATEGCNGTVTAIVDGGSAPYTYNWEQSDSEGPELFDLCYGEYFLQVRDRNGCLSELTSVGVEDRRFPCFSDRIILTPDNDGANEEFIILCVNEFPDNHLQIFNRWGQLVFEADNYNNTWNGVTQDGSPLPEGPYYYVLDYTDPEGNPRQQRGSLTILRED